MSDPILYILMSNDLSSLNPGKACAQAAHAGNHMANTIEKDIYHESPIVNNYKKWLEQGSGFGTTIVLGSSREQMLFVIRSLIEEKNSETFVSPTKSILYNMIIDPTYPFTFSSELLSMMDTSQFTLVKNNGKTAFATRNLLTCVYIFGNKEEIQPHIQHLELMP